MLDRLLREDHVDHDGDHYRTVDARTLPGPVQRPRVPFVIAANGPRSLRLAARHGQGWVTYGAGGDTLEDWWSGVGELAATPRRPRSGGRRGRPAPATATSRSTARPVSRWRAWTCSRTWSAGRAELGFTDVVTHWPRAEGVYAGDGRVLEGAASRVLTARPDAL